jgi:MoaA/NifB/PqqE/SkfB family radical SAM enzyme
MRTRHGAPAIDQFADAGGLSFTFGGGECLLHPDFDALLAHARARDLSVSILSNLTKLDDRHLAVIRDARISQLQVSIYSLKAEEHDHITQVPGSLAKTLAAVERLVAADVPVQVSCPVMRTNTAATRTCWFGPRSGA